MRPGRPRKKYQNRCVSWAFSLPPALREHLQRVAQVRGKSASAVIRIAIRRYLGVEETHDADIKATPMAHRKRLRSIPESFAGGVSILAVHISAKLHDQLRAECIRQGLNQSAVIRRMIRDYLNAREAERAAEDPIRD
jgi:predicted transcriptional regulator